MTRTNQSLRKRIINDIRAHNHPLGEGKSIDTMNYIALLRNVHPLYRMQYAKELKNSGRISNSEYKTIERAMSRHEIRNN
jgi:hypothetical protein